MKVRRRLRTGEAIYFVAAILLFVLAVIGGIAIWVTAFPRHVPVTRVEMKMPPPAA